MQPVKPPQEIAVPQALQALDDRLGTSTQHAYRTAVAAAPHLGEATVALTQGVPMFHLSPEGLSESRLTINPDRDFYLQGIKSGRATQRLSEFSQFYRSRGIAPGVNELVEAILLHEMGHGDDFWSYIQQASGDTKAAFELSRKTRKTQLAGLPLGAATSRILDAWEHNTDGYRDEIAARYTDEEWRAMLAENTKAYGELPCEKIPDRFALGVLATLHQASRP